MSAATAQVFGIIVVALALTLAATKLVADLQPRPGSQIRDKRDEEQPTSRLQ